MRPLRFLLSLATCILAFFFLVLVGPWRSSTQESVQRKPRLTSYLNWRTPSSLFPPSAVITLTDDNSTWFLARPAAFGPLLPAKSLTGQLWIGSGFGEDRLGRSGSAEGELGCSDVPGWGDGGYSGGGKSLRDAKGSWANTPPSSGGDAKRAPNPVDEEQTEATTRGPHHLDGTDDYLHHPLPASDGLKSSSGSSGNRRKSTHADIQSLQESAEIADKIVLLSRGGCGFLEKVKWVQRRGGIALIVGDDIRGEPLVTMYARGDTANVTIPSLFVSHTTAHLLSGLIPSGDGASGLFPEQTDKMGSAGGDGADSAKANKPKSVVEDRPTFTTSTSVAKATQPGNYQAPSKAKAPSPENGDRLPSEAGWFASLFGKKGAESRPPTSGNGGWILLEDFEDDQTPEPLVFPTTTTTATVAPSKTPEKVPSDGFIIGVQDWRDPDLVPKFKEKGMDSSSTSAGKAMATPGSSKDNLRGGSITPGSGEYAKAVHDALDIAQGTASSRSQHGTSAQSRDDGRPARWLSHFFSSKEEQTFDSTIKQPHNRLSTSAHSSQQDGDTTEDPPTREGLWVTLTPTSMSTSPFFDTLLVLVVSPLVTLTIVYALLLLRSRIRRRRWRAPKSVVERLPVRTYQTMPSTAAPSSATSSISSPITATTPLLLSTARPINARSRPRSRTTSEVPHQQSSPLQPEDSTSPSPDQIEEKRAAGLAEWRRRYGGKQRECVVCLEEYIDGVSRVMSLPCGHEFHAECITPWLTTRRRTCPICKGDVVRSLAKSTASASSSPTDPPYPPANEDADDIQEQAATTRNDDPSAARPVSREDEAFEDLERGAEMDRSR